MNRRLSWFLLSEGYVFHRPRRQNSPQSETELSPERIATKRQHGKGRKGVQCSSFKSVCIRVEVWSPNSKKPAILLIRASPDLPPPRKTIMKGCHTKVRSLGVEGSVVSIRISIDFNFHCNPEG